MTAPGEPLTIGAYLAIRLRSTDGVSPLTRAAVQVAQQPLADLLADLRTVTDEPVSVDAHRRLHLLISELYRLVDAVDIGIVDTMRALVTRAYPTLD